MLKEPISQVLKNPFKFLSKENYFGFYDWFCSTEALERRGQSLLAKFRRIARSTKINLDTSYLWFKNNCPMVGNLYDDFRISDLTTEDVLYFIVPKSGHHAMKGQAELYGFAGEPSKVHLELPAYKDVVAWFMAENKLIESMPDKDIPLHLNSSGVSFEGRKVLMRRLKDGGPKE